MLLYTQARTFYSIKQFSSSRAQITILSFSVYIELYSNNKLKHKLKCRLIRYIQQQYLINNWRDVLLIKIDVEYLERIYWFYRVNLSFEILLQFSRRINNTLFQSSLLASPMLEDYCFSDFGVRVVHLRILFEIPALIAR